MGIFIPSRHVFCFAPVWSGREFARQFNGTEAMVGILAFAEHAAGNADLALVSRSNFAI
jgi:hypothetical protein